MPTETIRPTAHTIRSGTVNDPTLAYNANLGNWATLVQATIGITQLDLHTQPADTSPTGRTQVLLKHAAGWGTADPFDAFQVYFRKVNTDPWTQVLASNPPDDWGASPSGINTLSADVTALAGTEPSTNWQRALLFYNGDAGNPNPPNPS